MTQISKKIWYLIDKRRNLVAGKAINFGKVRGENWVPSHVFLADGKAGAKERKHEMGPLSRFGVTNEGEREGLGCGKGSTNQRFVSVVCVNHWMIWYFGGRAQILLGTWANVERSD